MEQRVHMAKYTSRQTDVTQYENGATLAVAFYNVRIPRTAHHTRPRGRTHLNAPARGVNEDLPLHVVEHTVARKLARTVGVERVAAAAQYTGLVVSRIHAGQAEDRMTLGIGGVRVLTSQSYPLLLPRCRC